MTTSTYILIQTTAGKAAEVAKQAKNISGVISAEVVTGPYDIIIKAQGSSLDELGKMVVSRIQVLDGIAHTLTCPIVNL
ncbi:MAG: Lrp/AsnC ligand binding domain-containing protein [Actinobacteria bacterium]|nr:Lrp/AsnC ligand binding domain-containing protein [Actinomycetota bacterium]MCL6104366.1 Lrp/AsnC ligand binding domain-containing protein [Actinomycetota bacterium]